MISIVISVDINEKVLEFVNERSENGLGTSSTEITKQCNISRTWTWYILTNLCKKRLFKKKKKNQKAYLFYITKKSLNFLRLYEFTRFLREILVEDGIKFSFYMRENGDIDIHSIWDLFLRQNKA